MIVVQMDLSPLISIALYTSNREFTWVLFYKLVRAFTLLFPCLEHSYPGSLHNGLITVKSQLENHILREAFSDHPPAVILPQISLLYWLWHFLKWPYVFLHGVLVNPTGCEFHKGLDFPALGPATFPALRAAGDISRLTQILTEWQSKLLRLSTALPFLGI